MERWFCARTKLAIPFDTTINQLRQQEFTAWVPIVRSITHKFGKKIIIEEGLFGPYLFVQFDMTKQRWRAINHTVGVARLLPTHAEFPEPVSIGFVEALQNAPTLATVQDVIVAKFSTDAIVRILGGALVGYHGRVLSSHRTATRVRLEAFGREIEATVPTSALQAAD
jgi:transcription antitermination factor NusG